MVGQKRKRAVDSALRPHDDGTRKRIKSLEAGVIESRSNYNDIVKLQAIADDVALPKFRSEAVVSLCRVFCILFASGDMTKSKGTEESEALLNDWLREQYDIYCTTLLHALRIESSSDFSQELVVKLVMSLVKAEAVGSWYDHAWRQSLFPQFVHALTSTHTTSQPALDVFVHEYANSFDDVRYFTFCAATSLFNEEGSVDSVEAEDILSEGRLALLLALDPPKKTEKPSLHAQAPDNKKHAIYSIAKHKKQAQAAWIQALQSEPSESERKGILAQLTRRVAPCFVQLDLLADYLTDSINAGGATSLLALSGIYHLIQVRNLDYPSFYVKLYSLLDDGLLHSKQRSRFFRHLEVFMSSSHLPAALVASFIKRLARLALVAPPAGIIAVCPWIYNMLKAHPQCTFMIHRETHDPVEKRRLAKHGMNDPFEMAQADPMKSGAIDSSLWEIETLQSHYHPNVASLARIISEQFTKQSYKMEDFLDYSYAGVSLDRCADMLQ